MPPRPTGRPDLREFAMPMQPFQNIADLITNRGAQDRIADIEALRRDHPASDVIRIILGGEPR